MSQTNHNDCWIPASDAPNSQRRIIIWTKRPWLTTTKAFLPMSRHLDTGGAWYNPRERTWFHSDGTIAKDVTHWMEVPTKPKASRKIGDR